MSRTPEAFLMLCLLDSIDLPAIDAWLAALKPSPNRDQLLQRRRRAEELFQADPDDAAAWQAPLEFLGLAMHRYREREVIIPLARTGKKSKDSSARGNEIRGADAEARYSDWQARADVVWAESPDLPAWKVAEIIAKPGEKHDTIRRKIKRAR